MANSMAEFVSIGPRTSLYTPENRTTGELIVICTWLGAARKHIAKYTSLYQKIAPGARILLVESNIRILISYYTTQREAIRPAVAVILDTLAECGEEYLLGTKASVSGYADSNGQVVSKRHLRSVGKDDSDHRSLSLADMAGKTPPKILLHTFSNGGTNTATQLLIILQECTKKPVPFAGLLFDSCPSKGTYWKSYDAMILSLPQDPMSRILGAVTCHCILILLYTWIGYGNENPASLQRRTLLDESTIRGSGELNAHDAGKAGGERHGCYLYSKEDRMCDWRDVHDHAEEARRKGWLVKEVMFEGSGHCAHLSKDVTRYSDAVKDMWQGNVLELSAGTCTMSAKL